MELNPSQLQAVQSEHAMILCLAGPGSGKTRTLIERIRRLVRDRYDPAGFAAITFTNAAATELTERLDGITLGFVGTLHAFCLRLLQRHGNLLGFAGRLTVLDEDQTAAMINQIAKELNYKGTVAALQDAIAVGPQPFHPRSPEDNLNPGLRMSLAQLVAAKFFRTLRSGNLLTFDTVLHYGLALLTSHSEAVTGWTHLFCDEVQDGADIDFAIYRALPVKNRFMVGDPDQSIFRFRGANVQNVLALARDPACQTILLEDNYRSDLGICEVAQALIEHNPDRVAKRTRPLSAEAGVVAAICHQTEQQELNALAVHLRHLADKSCAVLLRTNRLVDQFAKALEGYGIPVARKKRRETPPDWRLCRTLLALLNDPENDLLAGWYIEATRGPKVAQEARLSAAAAGLSVNEHCLKIPEDVSGMNLANVMAKAGISRESIAAVTEILAGLPASSTLSDLLLALAEADNGSDEIGEGVTVSTLHGAKGREFDAVFMPACEAGIIPSGKDVPEERRLFFVGLTRARHVIWISWCASRKNPWTGQAEECRPSQFIAEADLM